LAFGSASYAECREHLVDQRRQDEHALQLQNDEANERARQVEADRAAASQAADQAAQADQDRRRAIILQMLQNNRSWLGNAVPR
jgi:hypothetical protein